MKTEHVYNVRFYKTVPNSYGIDSEICQRSIAVSAGTPETATERAIEQFCQAEQVCRWRDHADRLEIQPAASAPAKRGSGITPPRRWS